MLTRCGFATVDNAALFASPAIFNCLLPWVGTGLAHMQIHPIHASVLSLVTLRQSCSFLDFSHCPAPLAPHRECSGDFYGGAVKDASQPVRDGMCLFVCMLFAGRLRGRGNVTSWPMAHPPQDDEWLMTNMPRPIRTSDPTESQSGQPVSLDNLYTSPGGMRNLQHLMPQPGAPLSNNGGAAIEHSDSPTRMLLRLLGLAGGHGGMNGHHDNHALSQLSDHSFKQPAPGMDATEYRPGMHFHDLIALQGDQSMAQLTGQRDSINARNQGTVPRLICYPLSPTVHASPLSPLHAHAHAYIAAPTPPSPCG